MKRKYLAIVLSLTMAFTAASPVMASSNEVQVLEEVSEDMLSEQPDSDETEVSLSVEDTSEMNTDEEEDNSEIHSSLVILMRKILMMEAKMLWP